jgi:hypothetical protein
VETLDTGRVDGILWPARFGLPDLDLGVIGFRFATTRGKGEREQDRSESRDHHSTALTHCTGSSRIVIARIIHVPDFSTASNRMKSTSFTAIN